MASKRKGKDDVEAQEEMADTSPHHEVREHHRTVTKKVKVKVRAHKRSRHSKK